jgi:hypothetical protein
VKPFASFQEDFDISGGYRAVVKGKKKSKIYKELSNYRVCKNCPALFIYWRFNLASFGPSCSAARYEVLRSPGSSAL